MFFPFPLLELFKLGGSGVLVDGDYHAEGDDLEDSESEDED